MKLKNKLSFFSIGLVTLILTMGNGQVLAAEKPTPSSGEQSSLKTGFYSCKPGKRANTWKEVTTLTVLNLTSRIVGNADNNRNKAILILLDAQGNFLSGSFLTLSKRDMDEINICKTLQDARITVPKTGMLYLTDLFGQVHAWRKNYSGRFFFNKNDPAAGRVVSVNESELRVVSPAVESALPVITDFFEESDNFIDPVLIGITE